MFCLYLSNVKSWRPWNHITKRRHVILRFQWFGDVFKGVVDGSEKNPSSFLLQQAPQKINPRSTEEMAMQSLLKTSRWITKVRPVGRGNPWNRKKLKWPFKFNRGEWVSIHNVGLLGCCKKSKRLVQKAYFLNHPRANHCMSRDISV